MVAKPVSRNGMMSVLRYFAEGVLDPPPSSGERDIEADPVSTIWTTLRRLGL